MRVYAFGLEQHTYTATGSHTSELYYYSLAGRLLGSLDSSSNTTGFYLTDTLGSVLASFSNTDKSAAIAGNQVFGPYGNFRDVQGNFNTPKAFTGQDNDSLTHLDYYGSRYYDQVAGVSLCARRGCAEQGRDHTFQIPRLGCSVWSQSKSLIEL